MSQLGEQHKKLMRLIECAFHNVLLVESLMEHGAETEELSETMKSIHYFLVEAEKLAMWIDTGGAS